MNKIIAVLLHLRLPFSVLLMPVYFFALSVSPNYGESSLLWVFIILHCLLYPASNAYNSYFDKDEGPIGSLKNPPQVNRGVYYVSVLMDVIAIILAFWLYPLFAVFVFIYGMISKMYSHPSVRLKKYPWLSWFIVGLFQGFFTFLMIYVGLNAFSWPQLLQLKVILPALLSSLFLWGSYPLTQIFQHEEDAKRGDWTLSLRLGIRGTFAFSAVFLSLSLVAYLWYFVIYYNQRWAFVFLMCLSPVALIFGVWVFLVWKDESKANYHWAMLMSWTSALCLNIFFVYFVLHATHLIQLFR